MAADKLKIYSTVKLLSATDANPGPDLDDRPKFNVAIIYEDSAAAKRAKHFYDRVIRELVDECEPRGRLARFGPYIARYIGWGIVATIADAKECFQLICRSRETNQEII